MVENQTLGLIFSNMHDTMLGDLTVNRTMGSVPFGGRYRLIDFVISNMVNSEIDNIGVITKSNYQSLIDHLGSGKEWDLSRKSGGLHILPPFGNAGSGIYRGRMEALAGILNYVKSSKAKYVIMSDCDIIANIDFSDIVECHASNGCDMTIVYCKRDLLSDQASDSIVFELDENNIVTDVMSNPGKLTNVNVNMNVVVMNKDTLEKMIATCASRNLYSFRKDVLLSRNNRSKIYGYEFKGYMSQINSPKSYFDANMALLDSNVRKDLFLRNRPIYTKVRDEMPAVYGLGANVKNSIIADGCVIKGTVENSVIFRGVHIGEGAVVKNSIVMQSTIISPNSHLDYVMIDKDAVISEGRTLMGFETYPIYIAKNKVV